MSLFPPSTRFRRPATAVTTGCLCVVAMATVLLAPGCSKKPPPPPPPPPAPVDAVAEGAPAAEVLSPHDVAARLRPLFVALCEHGFNAHTLSSPVRSGTAAPEAAPASPPPSLAAIIEKECGEAGIDVATVVKCASDIRQKLTPRQARDAVLAMYVTQAIADVGVGNLHRAHVLLADVRSELDALWSGELTACLSGLERFFRDVPDEARLKSLAEYLDTYMQLQDEQLLLGGEHAAVLSAGGLADAAEFTRKRLATHFEFVTLPLIDLAIARGERYDFRAPAPLRDARARLGEHVRMLADGHSKDDAFLKEAKLGDVEQEQAALFAAAKKVPELVMAGLPLQYDSEESRFSLVGMKSLTDSERLAAVAEWCAGQPASEGIADGSGHMLLGLHWLAEDRPLLARAAFVAGAEYLLETAPSAERDADTKALVRQLNGYRLLVAAALVASSPPGAVVGSADATLSEIEVLLLAWRQVWLKARLPQKPADALVREFERALERRSLQVGANVAAGPGSRRTDRYFFFDYRFLGNGVPEVMVTKALAEELVNGPQLPELATTERFLEFVKGFQMPREFSTSVSPK